MKTSLQLKMGQQLTMTPQLQQAIRLLQLSTLDLQQEIQQQLESNPMLETAEDAENDADAETTDTDTKSDDDSGSEGTEASDDGEDPSTATEPESWENENWQDNNEIPENLPVDTAWDDVYQTAPAPSAPRPEDEGGETDFESRNSRGETLQDHLHWQLNLTPMSERDRVIAHSLVDAIDDAGYLTQSLEELHRGLSAPDDEDPLELDEVEVVLHRLQQFDPPGVAARDLRECLLIQLNQLPPETPWLKQARLVISHYIQLLGSRDYRQLMRRSRLSEAQLKDVLGLIQSLNPRPGDAIGDDETEYVVPDVIVTRREGRWKIELNPEIAPRLQVNGLYASLIRQSDASPDNTYLRDQLQEAKWFIKSLQSRNETLLKVASQIVDHQQKFFEEGEEAMKPLILSEIAQAVDMHESTISRVTTQKYMHTPRGIYELKYFFSSHVGTDDGGECSSTAIRAMIRKLIDEEESRKPLSDNRIASILSDQGINVARRTVAKYREAMHIPPSNERKRLV